MFSTRSLGAAVLVAALAACAAPIGGGGSAVPGADQPATRLRPIPIYSPTPTPAPPGLIGGIIGLVSSLTCGVTAGLTCHVLAGAGPQGLPAGTAASKLPGLHPADLQSAYGLASATAGAGQKIGIVVAYDDPDLEADLAVYRSTFGLPACTTANGCFKKVTGGGLLGALLGGNQGWGQESSLDVDVASAVCPKCKLVVVEAASDTPANLLAAAKTAVADGATVVTNSYSLAEYAGENDAAYQIGVPFVFGAGDSGPGAQWPASSSHVIAVGGTSLTRDGSPRGWSESVWAGSGGGCSAYVPKPAWQGNTGCSTRSANDVSAFADPNPGVAVYDSYLSSTPGWRTYGGTSVAAPIVAGAIALAGNGAQLSANASFVYAHAGALNAVGAGGYGPQAGNGSPNGAGGL
ncbi:MAG TPA: S8 family serine peptidase [Candidatus Baltobacteraceae bacterium]|nr:S8 family serine peptidase [Candidatus Baltobacteraceae bacterium]